MNIYRKKIERVILIVPSWDDEERIKAEKYLEDNDYTWISVGLIRGKRGKILEPKRMRYVGEKQIRT